MAFANFRSVALLWLPPIVVRLLRWFRAGRIRFEGDHATWEEAAAKCTGYDAAPILAKVLEATLKVKRGEAAYERDSVLFDEIEYAWPVTAALMWVAAQSGGRLDVLDFGGALGSSYFQNRTFLEKLPQVRWSVIEQAHYVQAGREHIQDETLRFYSSIDNCLAENRPNVALLSSVLEYLPDEVSCLENICKIGAEVIILDRTLISLNGSEVIAIQKVTQEFIASLPCRLMSNDKLHKIFKDLNYELLLKQISLGGIGSNYIYQFYLFKKIKI